MELEAGRRELEHERRHFAAAQQKHLRLQLGFGLAAAFVGLVIAAAGWVVLLGGVVATVQGLGATFHGKRGLYVETLRDASRELIRATAPDPEWPPEVRLRRGLEAYLDYAEAAGPGFVALLRGGVGADPEVFAVVEETRQEIVTRALASLGLAVVSPVLELAMRAWIGFVEAASVEYLRRRDVPREALLELMARTAVAAIESTLEAPTAG